MHEEPRTKHGGEAAPLQESGAAAWSLRFGHLLARWLLGGMLVWMGVSKALDPVGFLKLLREYQMLDSPWSMNAVAAWLPWLEIFCGVLFVGNVAVRGNALVVAGLFLGFSSAILLRAFDLQAILGLPFCSLRFDCGCGAGEVYVCHKLGENAAWLALSCWLLFSRHGTWKLFPCR